MEAHTALELFNSEDISIHQCFRALCQFEHWVVGAKEQNGEVFPVLNDGPDGHWLLVFSSITSYRNYLMEKQLPVEHPYLTIGGQWLFGNADDKIQGIALDVGTEHTMPIYQKQFEYLKQWSDALAVEKIISELKFKDTSEHLKAVAKFPRYFLPVTKTGDNVQIILTPDANNRQLAAVFTAQDAGELFIAEAKEGLGEDVSLQECSGTNLFNALQSMPLDGLVFNPSGPTAPVAFGIALLDAIMIANAEKG
jgi:hypothetical protein